MVLSLVNFIFFFSSRRRHTRCSRDWSSDVCSSDLSPAEDEVYGDPEIHPQPESYVGHVNPIGPRACYDEGKRAAETLFFDYHRVHRSEERRVGKECSSWWAGEDYHRKKLNKTKNNA